MDLVVVQFDIAWEDRPANHAQVEALLDASPPPPKSLIVLPEMFDTGFSTDTSATLQSPECESEDFLKHLAHVHQSAVLGGVVGPVVGGKASNEAVAFAPDGSELVRYRKTRLFTPMREQRAYAAGDGFRLFHWQGICIAPFVCYDLRFPELFRSAAGAGAELLVVIANWPHVRSDHWVCLLRARAIENQAYAVGVNRCGNDVLTHYDGRSCAYDPLGAPLLEAGDAPLVHRLSIDASQVHQWRRKFPALRDMVAAEKNQERT